MVDVCQEIPRHNEIVDGVLRLSSSAHNILMNVSFTPPRYKLKVIAGVLKEALEFDKHLAYDSSLKLDEAYALLLNMTHLVHSQLPTRRSSSSDRKEQPEPEPMQLMLPVFRKLISLKSDLKGEEDGENRDRVRELLAMLTDCNISLHTNHTMEIIVAVLQKAPVVEEQLPRQFQAKMREVHDILLDVKCSLRPAPCDHSSSVGSSSSVGPPTSSVKSTCLFYLAV